MNGIRIYRPFTGFIGLLTSLSSFAQITPAPIVADSEIALAIHRVEVDPHQTNVAGLIAPIAGIGSLLGIAGGLSLGGGYALVNYGPTGPSGPVNPGINAPITRPVPINRPRGPQDDLDGGFLLNGITGFESENVETIFSPQVAALLGPISAVGSLVNLVGRVAPLGGGFSLVSYGSERPGRPGGPISAVPAPVGGERTVPAPEESLPDDGFILSGASQGSASFQRNVLGILPSLDLPLLKPSNGYPIVLYGPVFTGAPGLEVDKPEAVPTPALTTGTPAPAAVSSANGCGAFVDLASRAVFTQLNTGDVNQIAAYARSADGTLCRVGTYPTGGRVAHAQFHHPANTVVTQAGYVINVNPGQSDTAPSSLSLLRIETDRLVLSDQVPLWGTGPHAILHDGNTLYVIPSNNQAGGDGIQAQQIALDATSGKLIPIALVDGATLTARGLSRPGYDTPVYTSMTEEGGLPNIARRIDTRLHFNFDGVWIAHAKGGAYHHLVVSQPADNTVSVVRLGPSGELALVDREVSDPLAQGSAGGEVAIAEDGNSAYAYVLNLTRRTAGHLSGFRIGADGDLVPLGASVTAGLPGTATGLSAM